MFGAIYVSTGHSIFKTKINHKYVEQKKCCHILQEIKKALSLSIFFFFMTNQHGLTVVLAEGHPRKNSVAFVEVISD